MGKTIKQLTEELEALKKENDKLREENRDALDTVGTLRESVSAYKAELNTREMELDIYKGSIERITTFIKEDTNIPYSIIEHVRAKELTAAKKEYYQWFKKITDMATVNMLREDNDELKAKTFHMEHKIDTLRSIIRNTRDDNDELKEAIAKKEKDYEAVKRLCRNLSDENKEAQETVNKQRDMLDYWHTFTLNHLKWPVYAVDKVEQGYYAEARTSLDTKGFVLFAKYENLKKFVCGTCVVAADMDETRAALEAEDWGRAKACIANYMHVHAEAENSIKDNYFNKELEAKEKMLDGAYAYIKNLENFFAKNHGYLDTDFEAIKQTGDTIPRYMANEAENAIFKCKNRELVNENCRLKKENEDLKKDYEDIRRRYFAQSFELGQSKMGPHFIWSTASDVYTCDLDGVKLIVHKDGGIEIEDGEVSFNVKDLHEENEKLKKDYEDLKRSHLILSCDATTHHACIKSLQVENDRLKKKTADLEMKLKNSDGKAIHLRNFMLDNLNYTGSIVQKIEHGRFIEALAEIEANKYPIATVNKVYDTAGDCDSDYPKLHWDHTGTPLLHWDRDTNVYTCNLNDTRIIVSDKGCIMLQNCKISFNAKAGCYAFDIGGHRIVATNGGHIFIDKE